MKAFEVVFLKESDNFMQCDHEHDHMGISPRTLSLRLRKLEADGIITRKIFAEVPLHIKYRLTEKGRSIGKVFQEMDKWG